MPAPAQPAGGADMTWLGIVCVVLHVWLVTPVVWLTQELNREVEW